MTVDKKNFSIEERIAHLDKAIQAIQAELAVLNRWKTPPNQNFLTKKDVANWIGCDIKTVEEYEKKGWLVSMFPNAKKSYLREDVLQFISGFVPHKSKRKASSK